MRFKAGNVVLLKSGGPDMTVEAVTENGVRCGWFDEKRYMNGCFVPRC